MSYDVHNFKSGDKLYAYQLNEIDEQVSKSDEDISRLSESVTNLNKDLGRLEDLETVDKSCLVGAVNEVKRKAESAGTGTVKSVNGTSPDANGNVAITVPSKTSQLTNDSRFLTDQDLSGYATRADYNAVIAVLVQVREALNNGDLDEAKRLLDTFILDLGTLE